MSVYEQPPAYVEKTTTQLSLFPEIPNKVVTHLLRWDAKRSRYVYFRTIGETHVYENGKQAPRSSLGQHLP